MLEHLVLRVANHPRADVPLAYIAPAGTPLTIKLIVRGLLDGRRGYSATAELCAELCRLSGRANAWPVVSGRAGMTLALRAMARAAEPSRNQVIIPAYTCYSVAAAVERAGLTPALCDVDPQTLSLNLDHLERIDCTRVVAVVTANLFGIPNSLVEIEEFARRRQIYLLDDAAQALGARIAGRAVGGFGDVGVFSFDKGKNISTMQGGALVSKAGRLNEALQREWDQLPTATVFNTAATAAKLFPYAALLGPTAYGLVRRIPMLRLGQTPYETRYPMTRLSPGLASLAHSQLVRIREYQATRVENAAALQRALEDCSIIRPIKVAANAEPAYPRFPVLAASSEIRARLLTELDHAGFGATAFYPSALVDVPHVARRMVATTAGFSGARHVAKCMITLPTHAYCPPGFADRIRRTVALVGS